MQQGRHRRGAHELELLPLGHVPDLTVCLHEGFFDSRLDLLVPRGGLHLPLAEVVHDVLVQLLGGVVGDLCPSVPIEDAKVHAQLLHGFVRDVPVLEGLLQARPALSVHTQAQGLCSHVVTLLLLLQRLRVRVDGQGLAVQAQHHDLHGAGPAVLLAGLKCNLPSLLEVDGVRCGATNDVLAVHEEALAHLLAVAVHRHDEAEALVGVPLLDPALGARFLLLFLFNRLRLRPRRLHDAGLLERRRRPLLHRRVAALVELDELRGLDGLAHLLGLPHLLDHGVVVVLDLAEGLGVAVLLDVVDLGLDVQVQASLRVVLPLARLLVHVPPSSIWRWLVVTKV
mmetsp:Transcript_64686/g.156360  ORF Transcript_64686/g.156360 Transcript_64686/m.156360 type:complete len:340 (-) Transcript_64686:221-1240(-)